MKNKEVETIEVSGEAGINASKESEETTMNAVKDQSGISNEVPDVKSEISQAAPTDKAEAVNEPEQAEAVSATEPVEESETPETQEVKANGNELTFEKLGLCEQLLKAAVELGFEKPTPVQARTIPQLLSSNDDLVSLAQTGTGKTAAFGFPILDKLFRGEFNKAAGNAEEDAQEGRPESAKSAYNDRNPKVLILSPTRELCKQIAEDLQRYAMFLPKIRIVCVYGGSGIVRQMKEVKEGADIIVATPGRILDLCKRNVAHLEEVSMFVLDEADQMLDMGFKDDLDAIVAELPQERQTLLFSATMPVEVENIAKNYTRNFKSIVVGQRNSGAQNVRHFYVVIKEEDRYLALKRIVDYFPEVYGIIFCRTKLETQEIAGKLMTDGYDVDSIHGDLTQDVREQVMKRFKDKTLSLLVATDVAARGIDVDSLTHVINYKLPDELEIYTHRSGRTGRADKEGQSIIIANSREMYRIRKIEKMIGKEIRRAKIPGGPEICKKQIEFLIDKLDDVTLPIEAFPYLPILEEKWKAMTRDQIIKKFLAVTANRFLEYYKNAPDLNYIGAVGRQSSSNSQHGDSSEKPSRSRRRKSADEQEQGSADERRSRGRRDDEGRSGRRGREDRERSQSGSERGRKRDTEERGGRRGRGESGRGRGAESKGRKRGETISEKQDRKWYEQFVTEVRENYSKDEKPRKRRK